jgi:hypothetical protein
VPLPGDNFVLRQPGHAAALAAITSLALLTTSTSLLGCASSRRVNTHDMVEVRGVIRDREGIGVSSVEVFLDRADDAWTKGWAVTTDRDGRFRMRVERGPYRWILFSRDARIPTVKGDTVHLAEPHEQLNYTYGGLKVEGRIFGPNGRPMKAGSVEAFGSDTNRMFIHMTGVIENGRYRIFLPASSYSFHANPSPARYAKVELAPQVRISADTTIDFTAAGHLVAGRVTLGQSKPLRGAEVRVGGGGDSLIISARDRTRSDGRFELYLPNGGYGIVLLPGPKDGHVAPRTYHLTVDGPQTISLDAAGVVWHGIVRDSTTRLPLRSVSVAARNPQFSTPLVCETDGQGRFMFVLEPGREYVLSVGKPRFIPRGERVRGVIAGKDSTFDLYLGSSGDPTSGLK